MTNKALLEQNLCCRADYFTKLYNHMKQMTIVIFSLNIFVMHVTEIKCILDMFGMMGAKYGSEITTIFFLKSFCSTDKHLF